MNAPSPSPPTPSPPTSDPPFQLPTQLQPRTIQTRRLILRAAHESDLDALHEMFSDEDVMRYWSSPPSTDKTHTLQILQNMISSPANGVLDFVIALLPDPSAPSSPPPPDGPTPPSLLPHSPIIGKAGIWNPATYELGFMLQRSQWGKGYMAETLDALLGPCGMFWEKWVQRVIADVDPRNEGSIGILRKFGFEETGREKRTFETHLGWCDSVYFELRRCGRGGKVGAARSGVGWIFV